MALSSTVLPNESLARFISEKSQYKPSTQEVKYKLFMPPSNHLLSVYRIDGLTGREVWDIGNQVISRMVNKNKLYGLAEIKVKVIQNEGLKVIPDQLPDRHANVTGWPDEQAQQLSIAQVLAAEAKLKLTG